MCILAAQYTLPSSILLPVTIHFQIYSWMQRAYFAVAFRVSVFVTGCKNIIRIYISLGQSCQRAKTHTRPEPKPAVHLLFLHTETESNHDTSVKAHPLLCPL
jgi:hypothetical protein